jgi:DNA-binding transcriptional LysR family regulator
LRVSELRQAAIDGNLAGGHEAAVRRRKKGSRSTGLRRIGHALKRRHRGEDLLALHTQRFFRELGRRRAGRQYVDPDARSLQVFRPAAREVAHRRLARTVGAECRSARGAGARSGQDDRTALAHQRQRLLGGEDRTLHIGIEGFGYVPGGDLAERKRASRAGIGEDDIEGSALGLHRRVEPVEIGQVGDRAFHRAGIGPEVGHSGVEHLLPAAEDEDEGPLLDVTPEGSLLLADARSIVSGVDTLKARAKSMTSGAEPELAVVVDVFFPTAVISSAAKAFASKFPLTPLRIFVEGLGAAYQPVLDGRCSLGILLTLPMAFPTLVSERLGTITLVAVAATSHPLAQIGHRIPRQELAKAIQLVLTDRSDLLAGRDYGVMSPHSWRLADLSTKHAFLKDGLGWGEIPLHMVEQDIADGRLRVLDVDELPGAGTEIAISAFHQASNPPGPAGRWLIEHLKTLAGVVPL